MIEAPMSEHTMTTWDGTALFYRAWIPQGSAGKALLVFHRGHEHSGRMAELVSELALDDVSVFAWDARGHGRSPGERGSADSLATVIKDAEAFARHVSAHYGVSLENTAVLAQSVGAVIAAAWVHDYAPPIRGMVLAVPALRVKLYVPLAIPLLRMRQALFGRGYVKSYVKAKMLTHDAEQAQAYHADELIFRQIAVNILLDLHDTSTRLMDDAGAITCPVLVLGAGSDWVVKLSAQKRLFEGLGSPHKQMQVFPGFYHAIYHEKERTLPVARTREFILDLFNRPADRPSLLEADQRGYTKDEYDRLRRPASGLRWALPRLAMRTICKLSQGIRLGWSSGFDSGVTLDYVYANRAQGITPLGRLIDRAYLDSPGWRGIRTRKINLQKALRFAIDKTRAARRPLRLLDIASGPGRYVLETLRLYPHLDISAILRDYKEENIAAGRRLAGEMNVTNVTYAQGDAFDRAALAAIAPRPAIAIVSGLYELFPDNTPVLESLRGLADAVEPGGFLIYTNQPWHPQIEFIARVLRNREGQPWVMRRRTQAEMDELVNAAGFQKIDMEIDQWGIFTVSVAQRR